MTFTWTPDRVELLRRRRDSGASASEIARELGTTRCAVLGKAARVGMSRRVRVRNAAPAPSGMLLDEILAIEPDAGVPVYRLRLCHCRWVTSSNPPWLFCGEPVVRKSYCAEHAARVYVKQKEPAR